MVLSDTVFERNHAFLGAFLFVSNLKSVRLNCSSGSLEPKLEFFKRAQWESMKIINTTEGDCAKWKSNHADRYRNIATYASGVYAEVEEGNKIEQVRMSGNPTVIKNYASGSLLPTIWITIIDDLGQWPAIGIKNDTVQATMISPDGFILGTVSIPLINGKGNFTGITGFCSNGTYELVIEFSEKSLNPLKLYVEVRQCRVGESSSSDGSLCVECNTATYSFHPEEAKSCQPCPEMQIAVFLSLYQRKATGIRFHALNSSKDV